MAQRPLLLGHRGACAVRALRENTVPSFEHALTQGCDGFEFDVRLTKDRQLVLCHDPASGRRSISRTRRRDLPLLSSLDEVLECFYNRAFLDIELKVKGLESKVLEGLRKWPPERGYVVSSFFPDVLWELKARKDPVVLGIICDKPGQLTHWPDLPVDYVIPHRSLVTRNLIESVHNAGKKLIAWTVNERKSMLRFAEMEVDGIISDRTDLLVTTFRNDS